MRLGTVKWFDYRRGYGFIVSPEGDDVMVHYATIKSNGFRCLYHGEQVEYEATRGPRGWQATAVRQFGNCVSVSAEVCVPSSSVPAPSDQPVAAD
jgi:cold shock protein